MTCWYPGTTFSGDVATFAQKAEVEDNGPEAKEAI